MKIGDDLDVDGPVNSVVGFTMGGVASLGKVLRGDGTQFISSDDDAVTSGWYTAIDPLLGYTSFGGGTATRGIYTASLKNGQVVNSGGAVNTGLQWTIPLPAGTYTVSAIVTKTAHAPKVTAILDGVSGSEIDFYNNGDVFNFVVTWTGLVITGAMASRILQLKATSKNASASSLYLIYVADLGIIRTA